MLKKLLYTILLLVLGLSAALIYQNLPGKRHARHIAKARSFAHENNFTAALQEYQMAYAAVGGFSPYVSLEVLLFMNARSRQDGDFKGAMHNAEMYVRGHPGDKQGLLVLADAALQAGKLDQAARSLNSVLREDPGYFKARLLLAEMRLREGRPDTAEEQLRYLRGKYPDSSLALLPLAEDLVKAGRAEESRRFALRAAAAIPANERVRMLLADAYAQDGKGDSILPLLLSRRPSDSAAAVLLAVRKARIHFQAGRRQEAELTLVPYRGMWEANQPALSEWALLKARQGQYDSAILLYSAMAASMPERLNASTLFNAYLHLAKGNPAGALEDVKTLQIGGRDSSLAALELACHLAMGREFKAEAMLENQPDSLRLFLKEAFSRWNADKGAIGPWAWDEYLRIAAREYWEFSSRYTAAR